MLDVVNDSLKAYADFYEDLLHLKGQTGNNTKNKVYGSSFVKVDNIKARTLVWEKNKYRTVPVTDLTRNYEQSDNVFYDDSYYYTFNYPSVASGNRTVLEYREVQKDPRMISGFLVSSYAPQVRATFRIKTTEDVDLYYRVLNDPGNRVQFNKIRRGKSVTYEWSVEDVPSMKIEPGSPDIRFYEPHIICYVRSYLAGGKKIEVLPDVRALHTWYRSFIRDLDEEPSEELAKVVGTIKANSTNDLAIVQGVYQWVQSNINYIAFEDGMRGYVPHRPSYTCEKKYGDCKDMASIIVGMLKIAGIKGYYTWIGTRNKPYRYTEYPTPYVDDHMIATYIASDGRYYFLDATSKYLPFGFPSSMIQSKEALISFDDDNFEVKEVPIISGDENLITDSLTIRLENDEVVGTGSITLAGLSKSQAGWNLERVEQKDVKDFVIRIAGKGSNKFYLDNYTISRPSAENGNTEIAYNFRIGDYFQRYADELYINLNLSKENYNRLISDATRKTPHEFEFQYDKSEYIEFTIPEGYEVEYLPKNEIVNGLLTGCSFRYEVLENKILFSKQFYVHYILLNPEQFSAWNSEIGKISSAYKEAIILKKKNQ
jgi:transglutaminase-like putative cysteine protease